MQASLQRLQQQQAAGSGGETGGGARPAAAAATSGRRRAAARRAVARARGGGGGGGGAPPDASTTAPTATATVTPAQARARSRWALFPESRGDAADAAGAAASRLAATDGGLAAARRAAAAAAKPGLVVGTGGADGGQAVRLDPADYDVLPPRAYDTDDLLDGLDGVDSAAAAAAAARAPTDAQTGRAGDGASSSSFPSSWADPLAHLGRPPATVPGVPAPPDAAEVPAFRRVRDRDELELVGQGLPLPNGGGTAFSGATRGRDRRAHGGAPEWPEAYRGVLTALAAGRPVPVPLPHPKFALPDLERLRAEGGRPRWGDVVLEHAERISSGAPGGGAAVGEAWRFVPATVLGDLELEVEPAWLDLPRMSAWDFWQGLRRRNWTDARAFDASAQPWRVQFFECAHGPTSVTRWPGRRAVVTPLGRRSRRPEEARRFWVDMPEPGADTLFDGDYKAAAFSAGGGGGGADAVLRPKRQPAAALAGRAAGDPAAAASTQALPSEVGWRQAYEQVFSAYEQRAPRHAVESLLARGGVPLGSLPYDCPGERALEVSWHRASGVGGGGPFAAFLARPSFGGAAKMAADAVLASGIVEARYAKELIAVKWAPEVALNLSIPGLLGGANAGPIYFGLILTLGVVVPALR